MTTGGTAKRKCLILSPLHYGNLMCTRLATKQRQYSSVEVGRDILERVYTPDGNQSNSCCPPLLPKKQCGLCGSHNKPCKWWLKDTADFRSWDLSVWWRLTFSPWKWLLCQSLSFLPILRILRFCFDLWANTSRQFPADIYRWQLTF